MFSHHSKIVAAIGGLFLCGTIIATAFFVREVEKRKVVLHTKSTEQAEIEFHKKSLATLTTALENTKAEREFVASRILEEADVITFLTLIEDIAREQRVTLVTNSLTVQPIDETFETLVVNVSIEGGHDAVLHTFKILEHLPYQGVLSSVRLEKGATESGLLWKGACEVRVTKFKKV